MKFAVNLLSRLPIVQQRTDSTFSHFQRKHMCCFPCISRKNNNVPNWTYSEYLLGYLWPYQVPTFYKPLRKVWKWWMTPEWTAVSNLVQVVKDCLLFGAHAKEGWKSIQRTDLNTGLTRCCNVWLRVRVMYYYLVNISLKKWAYYNICFVKWHIFVQNLHLWVSIKKHAMQ